MNHYCIKCLMFIKNNKITVKHKLDKKKVTSSHCNDYSWLQFATIDKEELSDLLKKLTLL